MRLSGRRAACSTHRYHRRRPKCRPPCLVASQKPPLFDGRFFGHRVRRARVSKFAPMQPRTMHLHTHTAHRQTALPARIYIFNEIIVSIYTQCARDTGALKRTRPNGTREAAFVRIRQRTEEPAHNSFAAHSTPRRQRKDLIFFLASLYKRSGARVSYACVCVRRAPGQQQCNYGEDVWRWFEKGFLHTE